MVTGTFASGGTDWQQSILTINASTLSGVTEGDTFTISNGGTSVTLQYVTGTNTASGSNVGFSNAASLSTDLSTAFGASNVTNNSGTITLQSSNAQDYTTNYTATAGNNTDLSSLTTPVQQVQQGDTFTVYDGTHTATFRLVANGQANAANGTFSSASTLAAAIDNAASNVHGDITAANPSGNNFTLTAAKSVTITAGGSLTSSYNTSTNPTSDNYNSTLAGLSGTLTVQVGSDSANTLAFGSGNGQISTGTELASALAGLSDITGSINSSNQIDFAPQSSANVTIGGTSSVVTGLGLSAGTTAPTATVVTPDPTRQNLQDQYNALLGQIDQLAGDSSYNGVNLINGDNLNVVFNETSSSGLTIQGVNLNSAGLGLDQITGTGFQDNNVVQGVLNAINGALTTLRTQASTFGSNLTTVQTRQDFTQNLINTLQTGSDNLVLADTNQEGADLLALQTRQQLSTTALSLSAQADQNVLKLFGG